MVRAAHESTRNQERWLGLRSYGENNSDSFFGRDEEVDELFRLVEQETLTTLFAPSGTGKTSLLQAGLFPRLKEAGYLPVRIRLNHSVNGIDHRKWFRQKFEEAVASHPGVEIDEVVECQAADDEEELLWEYMHRIDVWDENNRPLIPVIILDQFEEIFTIGKRRKESAEFLQSLADLAEKRMPVELRNRLGGRPSEIPLDIQSFRIVLALREDFVAHLDGLRKQMPSVMRNRYGLRQMNGLQAMEVVLGPGRDIVEDEVAREIVEIAAKADGDEGEWDGRMETLTVEPNLLSLLCAELDRRRLEQGEKKIVSVNLKEDVENILRKFYEESFKGVKTPARDFVEEHLVDVRGYRMSWKVSDAEEEGLDPESRELLLQRYILRSVDEREDPQVELAHDLLTGPARESRERRAERVENERLLRARKKARFLATVFGTLLIVAGAAVVKAISAERSAVESKEEAERSAEESAGLLNFMANDLYDRLLPIGRVDILESVAERAQEHFESDAGSLSSVAPRELAVRASVRSKFADVLVQRGDILAAIEAYEDAIRMADAVSGSTMDSEEVNQLSASLASVKAEYATVLADWMSPTKALEVCDEALSLTKEDSIVKEIGIAKARAYLALGDSESVHATLDSVEPSSRELGATIAEIKRLRGAAHRIAGELPAAFDEVRSALSVYNRLADNEPGNEDLMHRKASVLRELGHLHLAVGDTAGAKDKLLPALAIADNRLNRRTGGDASDEIEENLQWKHFSAMLSNDLAEVWLQTGIKETSIAAGQRSEFIETAEAYLERASRVLEAFVDDTNPSVSLQFERNYVENQRIKGALRSFGGDYKGAIESFEVGLKRLKGIPENCIEFQLSRVLFLWQIAKLREDLPRENALPPEEFFVAIKCLDRVMSNEPSHVAVLDLYGDIHWDVAAAYKQRGRARKSLEASRRALEFRKVFARKSGDSIASVRKSAEVAHDLANYLTISDNTDEARGDAIELFSWAAKEFSSLEEDDLFRTEDRLASARSLFEKGVLLEESGESEEALAEFRRASALGLQEASLKLPESEPTKAELQEAIEFLLPCSLQDELQGGHGMNVKRLVYSPVIIAGGYSNKDPIHEEVIRLKRDLMLNVESAVLNEIEKRYRLLEDNPEAKWSLVQFTDFALVNRPAGLSIGSRDRRDQLNLHSPVSAQYPQRVPTVIGSECWLNWSYVGTADDLLEFQLQVSTEKDFAADAVFIDETVNGTRFRCNFREDDRIQFQNHKLYWRVRQIPGLESKQGSAGTWSLVQELEVYDSVWSRIVDTGVLRVGVSEFEGDLLDLDNSEDHGGFAKESEEPELAAPSERKSRWGGFDGHVLDTIWHELSEKFQQEREALGMPTEDLLEVKPYVYGWEGMFEAVSRNEVDFALSSITRTKERESHFGLRFSEPYFENKLAIVFREDVLPSAGVIEKIDDVRHLKLAANEGLRGAEVGLLIVGEENLDAQSEANLPRLIKKIRDFECDGAITDQAYLHRAEKEGKISFNGLNIVELNSAHYDQMLEIARSERLGETAIKELAEMQSDFGRAEWEQYAIATSETDHPERILLNHLNEIILEMRRNGEIRRFCRGGEELPIPERLLGKDQQLEETRKLATIIPISPNYRSKYGKRFESWQTVMGDSIEFVWQPMLESEAAGTRTYKLQIARSDTFEGRSRVFSDNVEGARFVFDPSKYGVESGGQFYWRAKLLEQPPFDLFPSDGWCAPVAFEYFRDSRQRIQETGKLLVGVNVTNGFSYFLDPETDEPRGFDAEIASHLASSLGEAFGVEACTPEFVEMDFASMFRSLQTHRIDLAISGITRLEERERLYDIEFSNPYVRTKQAAIWLRQNGIESPRDLIGKRFTVFEGTRAHRMAELFDGDISPAKNTVKAFLLERISNGNADAAITDYPTAIKLIEDYRSETGDPVGNQKFAIGSIDRETFDSVANLEVENDSLFVDEYGIPMRNDQQELIKEVNAALDRLIEGSDPELERIFRANVRYDVEQFSDPPFEFIGSGND